MDQHDIFISYSRRDAEIVDQFVERLIAANYKIWIDRNDIILSQQYLSIITQAIDNSTIVLFFSSINSNNSDWTVREIIYATNHQKPIIQIKIDNSNGKEGVELLLCSTEHIQYDKNDFDHVIERLLSDIKKIIDLPADESFQIGEELFEKSDYKRAFNYYRSAAEKGHADAQYKLGACYQNGWGVAQDPEAAISWYFKAIRLGNTHALNNLAYCYEHGIGVKKDLSKAVELYTEAANKGNACAQYNLAYCYDHGIGVNKDCEEAVKWYLKSALQGDDDAQNRLGECYFYGRGIEQDYDKAMEWFEKAAEQGNATAQRNIDIYTYEV